MSIKLLSELLFVLSLLVFFIAAYIIIPPLFRRKDKKDQAAGDANGNMRVDEVSREEDILRDHLVAFVRPAASSLTSRITYGLSRGNSREDH